MYDIATDGRWKNGKRECMNTIRGKQKPDKKRIVNGMKRVEQENKLIKNHDSVRNCLI